MGCQSVKTQTQSETEESDNEITLTAEEILKIYMNIKISEKVQGLK